MKITVKDGMGREPNPYPGFINGYSSRMKPNELTWDEQHPPLPAYDQQGNVLGDGEWEVVLSYLDVNGIYSVSPCYVIYQSTEVKQEVDDRTEYEEYLDAIIDNRKNSGLFEDDCVTLKANNSQGERVEEVAKVYCDRFTSNVTTVTKQSFIAGANHILKDHVKVDDVVNLLIEHYGRLPLTEMADKIKSLTKNKE